MEATQKALPGSPPLTVQARHQANSAEQDTASSSGQVQAQPRTQSEHARDERESHAVQPVVTVEHLLHSQLAAEEQLAGGESTGARIADKALCLATRHNTSAARTPTLLTKEKEGRPALLTKESRDCYWPTDALDSIQCIRRRG